MEVCGLTTINGLALVGLVIAVFWLGRRSVS